MPARCCRACGATIPDRRLQAVPSTVWCVRCAEERVERLGGNPVWTHKTAPEVEIKPESEAQAFASKTRRLCYNACLGLSAIGRTSWGDDR